MLLQGLLQVVLLECFVPYADVLLVVVLLFIFVVVVVLAIAILDTTKTASTTYATYVVVPATSTPTAVVSNAASAASTYTKSGQEVWDRELVVTCMYKVRFISVKGPMAEVIVSIGVETTDKVEGK